MDTKLNGCANGHNVKILPVWYLEHKLEEAICRNRKYAITETIIYHQFFVKTRSLRKRGQYQLAITRLTEALELMPHWTFLYYELVINCIMAGDLERGLKYYRWTVVCNNRMLTGITVTVADAGENAL